VSVVNGMWLQKPLMVTVQVLVWWRRVHLMHGGSWCLFDRVGTVMVVRRLLEGRVLLVIGRRDQRRWRLTISVLEGELERWKVVQQRSVVSLSRQVRKLVRHRRRRRFEQYQ